MKFDIIVMTCKNNGIGYEGTIPWKEPEDMKYFREITTAVLNPGKKNAIIMGRKTYDSIGKKPLKNRVNCVISKETFENVDCFKSLDECLGYLKQQHNIENIFVIGGFALYDEAMKHKQCRFLYKNVLNEYYECDTFFPYVGRTFTLLRSYELTDKIMCNVFIKN